MSEGQVRSIELTRTGGQLSTYAPAFKVTPDTLNEADRHQLESLLEKINFAGLPARFPGKPLPDSFEYALTVHRDNTTHSVTFRDMDGHPQALDELVRWMRSHANR